MVFNKVIFYEVIFDRVINPHCRSFFCNFNCMLQEQSGQKVISLSEIKILWILLNFFM